LIETTEFQTRSTPRVTFCQARRDVIRRQAFHVVTQLAVQLNLEFVTCSNA